MCFKRLSLRRGLRGEQRVWHLFACDFSTADLVVEAHDSQNPGIVFAKIQARFAGRESALQGLICKQGFYKRCFVLKLQKAAWTNDPMDRVQNESGIFFAIWIEEDAASRNRANYNIHALKLRELAGYSIRSRDFAEDFRNQFAPVQDAWPNVRTNYGPQTLMQGWIEFRWESCETAIFALMERFEKLSPVIDRLLEARRRQAPTPTRARGR